MYTVQNNNILRYQKHQAIGLHNIIIVCKKYFYKLYKKIFINRERGKAFLEFLKKNPNLYFFFI